MSDTTGGQQAENPNDADLPEPAREENTNLASAS